MKEIKVHIDDRDPGDPVIECPLRNSEYFTCQALQFLRQEDRKCPVSIEVEEGPMAGWWIYLVPKDCPLRGGGLKLTGV